MFSEIGFQAPIRKLKPRIELLLLLIYEISLISNDCLAILEDEKTFIYLLTTLFVYIFARTNFRTPRTSSFLKRVLGFSVTATPQP